MALEILAPIVMGVLVGIVDIAFMIKDLSGDAKSTISHGLGAIGYLIALSFVAFNINLATDSGFLPTFFQNNPSPSSHLPLFDKNRIRKNARFASTWGPVFFFMISNT